MPRINKISWWNYKGLDDGSITADGNNVFVSGRNGSGKSSIASILPFVLFGKVNGTLRKFDSDGLTPSAGLIHAAEVTFDNGLTLRRELHDNDKNDGSTTVLYVNGARAKTRIEYDAKVFALTGILGYTAIAPLTFCTDKDTDRRALLLKIMGTDKTELDKLDKALADMTYAKGRAKLLKDTLTNIDGARKEIADQLADAPPNPIDCLKEIQKQIAVLQDQQTALAKSNRHAKAKELTERINVIKQTIQATQSSIDKQTDNLDFLRGKYRQLVKDIAQLATEGKNWQNSTSCACPTCGQSMPRQQFLAKRQTALDRIIEAHKAKLADRDETAKKGKIDAESLNADKLKLDNLNAKLTALLDELNLYQPKDDEPSLDDIQPKLAKLYEDKARIKNFIDLQKRLDTKTEEYNGVAKEIASLNNLQSKSETAILQLTEALSDQINSQFKLTRFKLYDFAKTTGELKTMCEPMSKDGVPYSSLSSGEKVKLALDILSVFQAKSNIELPLMLDNAESCTGDYLSHLPNQIFAYCVSDTDLMIEIDKPKTCVA